MPVLGVYRTIVRHVRHIGDAKIISDLRWLKCTIRSQNKTRTQHRSLRLGLARLYQVEAGLRDVCLNRSTVTKFREMWSRAHIQQIEKNQAGSVYLWLQHDDRRFDRYNSPPSRGSSEFSKVDRQSKFAVACNEFKRIYKCPEHSQNVAIETIFTPYWKSLQHKRPEKPRSVEIRSIKRSAGNLSLLRVCGVSMRSIGFRRYVDEVDTKFHERFEQLEKHLWLATQYSNDKLDGDDMSEWIEHLNAELRRQKHKLTQLGYKLEVQRRILARRRAELERDWEWKFRYRSQNRDKYLRLNPPRLLTLDKL